MQIPSVVFQDNSEYGRIKIYTDEEQITADNVVEIFNTAYILHNQNAIKEEQLFGYQRGCQDILTREKPIRSDINEKLVINKASQIVDIR